VGRRRERCVLVGGVGLSAMLEFSLRTPPVGNLLLILGLALPMPFPSSTYVPATRHDTHDITAHSRRTINRSRVLLDQGRKRGVPLDQLLAPNLKGQIISSASTTF